MNKKITLILIFIIYFFFQWNIFANTSFDNIKYNKNVNIDEAFSLDLSDIQNELEEEHKTNITFEWDIRWASTRSWNNFNRHFSSFWEKDISLSVYKLENNEKKLILNKNISLFVYKDSIPVIFDDNINKIDIINLIDNWKKSWVYVFNLWEINENNISNENILSKIKKYNNLSWEKSDYILIWWKKDFLLSIISKLNTDINSGLYSEKINLVLMSPFNINVLQSYLNNFLSDKKWIDRIILTDDSSRFHIIKVPSKISNLSILLTNNEYEFLDLNIKPKIDSFLFISKFINNLSNKWFNTKWIYLIIIIPFILLLLSFTKHFLWFSPIWIIIPVSFTLLIFKVWITIALIILLFLILINILLGKITNKYTLLYTPKISLIITINIIIFFIIINNLYYYNIINTNINDVMFIIFFITISERLITIVLWKDFTEYKFNLLNTIAFSIICYLILNIDLIKIFILAYPEIILTLIPLNFIMWKFTWLRITEYFRFKEVIKNIEE